MRILMTMFGWNEVGGGTSYPRQVAVDLSTCGHQVQVFYTAVPTQMPVQSPLKPRLHQHQEDGVSLIGVQDRPSLFLDHRHPQRECLHEEIAQLFKKTLWDFQPDIVHFHNFLGLSAGLTQISYEAGIPSIFSAHNFWMLCPTLYLTLPNGGLCQGVNVSGENCLQCAKYHPDPWNRALPQAQDYVFRRDYLRQILANQVDQTLLNSEAVRQLFLDNGFEATRLSVQKLSNQRSLGLWKAIGSQAKTRTSQLRIGYIGQIVALKGVHILIAAAQQLKGEFELHIHGMGDDAYLQQLKQLDQRNCAQFFGGFTAQDQYQFLREIDLGVVTSLVVDHSPLVISEMQAAGIPVIGARIGGIPDYLQHDASALFEAGDINGLAILLQSILDDPERLNRWRQNLLPPPHQNLYLQGVLERYENLIAQSQHPKSEYQKRRIHAFLTHRQKSGFYQAKTLWPLQPENSQFEEYGIDLFHYSDLKRWPESYLKQAKWCITPDPSLTRLLKEQGVNCTFVPLFQKTVVSPAIKSKQVLLSIDQSCDWEEYLSHWLQHQSSEVLPCLLPDGDVEQAQNRLLNWLEKENLDAESSPEMVFLDLPEDEWALIFQEMALIVWPRSLPETWRQALLNPDVRQYHICQTLPLDWERLFKPIILPEFSHYLPTGWFFLTPSQTPIQKQETAFEALYQLLDPACGVDSIF